MAYLFRGRLCGYVCAECPEPLANVKVKLYRVDRVGNVAALAVANPKETFGILDDGQVQGKESRLLAVADTDGDGGYVVEFGDDYNGEPFEVDVYCDAVPRSKREFKARQFTITTVQPRFRQTDGGYVAVWDYCLPHRFWCAILALFDIWTICGRVVDCETKRPIAGVKVKAFDADWLADDLLGAAVTDATGRFMITYSSVDFKQGTWIDVELIGGPDLYFKIEDGMGAPLLTESQSRGRAPDRENAANCFCVELCIKQPLTCELTAPTGCTAEQVNQAAGFSFVPVLGSVSGGGFGSYILEVLQAGSVVPGVTVLYPGGGSSGTLPVVMGELGQINTTPLMDGAYTVRLTVYSAGVGTTVVCTKTLEFTLLKIIVYMNKIGKITTDPQPLDPAAELRAGGVPKAVGGTMSIEGAAYVYGCVDRMVKKYDIRIKQVTAPGTEPPQPATDDPIPAGWSVIPSLPLEYTLPSQHQPWTRIGPASRDLVNSWKTFTTGGTTYYALNAGKWGSTASGRYSMLLVVEDTAAPTGHRYYDIQHLWLDNRSIYNTVQIVKFQRFVGGVWSDIPACMDLMLSFGKIRIVGLAWDPIIDEAWWPPVAPNDNFSHYRLDYWKQFGASHELLGNTTTRVPALPALPPVVTPTVADAGELAQWDLTTLDAGVAPSPYVAAADPKIYRGESCAYSLQLFATDSTAVSDNSSTHYRHHQVAVKVVNDL